MTSVTEQFASLGRPCRHFCSRRTLTNDSCGIGHPIERIVRAANGGSSFGTAFMYPCRPGPNKKADCPDYDPRTQLEIDTAKEGVNKHMQELSVNYGAIRDAKARLAASGERSGEIDCIFCGARNSMLINVAWNNHAHASCRECKMGFME